LGPKDASFRAHLKGKSNEWTHLGSKDGINEIVFLDGTVNFDVVGRSVLLQFGHREIT
jgi:hypothetical protein